MRFAQIIIGRSWYFCLPLLLVLSFMNASRFILRYSSRFTLTLHYIVIYMSAIAIFYLLSTLIIKLLFFALFLRYWVAFGGDSSRERDPNLPHPSTFIGPQFV